MGIEHNPVLAENPNAAFNVFLMMRFADSAANRKIVKSLRAGLHRYGMNLLRADQKAYSASLWENVKLYMNACNLGVAVFEQLVKKDYNPNVSLELGHMLALEKKVLLLKEHHLPRLPSDIVGHLYKEFDVRDIATTIRGAIDAWLRDIGIAKSTSEKLVVFVSYGGNLSVCHVKDRCSKGIRRQKPAVFNSLRVHGCHLRNFRSGQQWCPKSYSRSFRGGSPG